MAFEEFESSRRAWIRYAVAAGLSARTAGAAVALPVAKSQGRLAVCLGSGAVHGFAHVGVIRALQRLGLQPDLIVGCSAGAVAGALWAAGLDAEAIASVARDPSWREASILRWPRLGVVRNDALARLVDRHVGRIESFRTRFVAVATDLATGRPVILDRGPAGRAVAASAAIPLRFEPMEIDGRLLVDGALSAPLPVDIAYAAGVEKTLAIDVSYRPREGPVADVVDVARQSIHILVNSLLDEQVRRATLAIRLDLHELVLRDPSYRAVEAAGERAVVERWAEIRAMAGASDAAAWPCQGPPPKG